MLPTFCLEDEAEVRPSKLGEPGYVVSCGLFSSCPACREWLKSFDIWKKVCGSGSGLLSGSWRDGHKEFISRVGVSDCSFTFHTKHSCKISIQGLRRVRLCR